MNLEQRDLSRRFLFRKNNTQATTATIQLKASSFKRLKITVALAAFTIIALLFALNDLNQKNQEQASERAELQAQISSLHRQLGQEQDSLEVINTKQQSSDVKAMNYIQGIEDKLKTINNYLSKRGLHGFSFKHIKTDATSPTKAQAAGERIYSSYNNYLTNLVRNVAYMPMGYPRISAFTSFFGYRGNPFDGGESEFHPGVDFRGKTGDPVKCTANGTVEFAGRAGGYGNCVRIRHINHLETVYGHLSRISVRVGQKVSVGDVIGKVGSTGRSTGSHLHYEVRRNGKPVNPVQYLSLN